MLRWLRQQTTSHHALVTNADPAGSGHHPRTSDQAILAGFSCNQRCTLCRCQATTDTTDRQKGRFSISLLFFPTRGKHQTGTRTHRHTAQQTIDERRLQLSGFVPRIRLQFAPVFPALQAIFEGLFKVSCFLTVSLNNSGAFPELRTFLPILQLSAAFTSRKTIGESKLHCLSLGLHNIRIQFPVFSDPSVI